MTILSKEELAFIHRRSGAAEIEPKPQDGRRMENRMTALEGLVEKLSRDQPTRLTDLQQQVQALVERVNQHEAGFMQLAQGIGVGDMFAVDHATPPHPAAPLIDPEDVYKVLRKHIGGDEYARIISQDVSDFLNGYTNG